MYFKKIVQHRAESAACGQRLLNIHFYFEILFHLLFITRLHPQGVWRRRQNTQIVRKNIKNEKIAKFAKNVQKVQKVLRISKSLVILRGTAHLPAQKVKCDTPIFGVFRVYICKNTFNFRHTIFTFGWSAHFFRHWTFVFSAIPGKDLTQQFYFRFQNSTFGC